MALLLKNAHVVDPSVELDGVVDVLIDGDKIAEVGENLAVEGAGSETFRQVPRPRLRWICTFTFASPATRSKRTSRAVPAQLPRAALPACAPCPTRSVTDNGTVVEFVKSRACRGRSLPRLSVGLHDPRS